MRSNLKAKKWWATRGSRGLLQPTWSATTGFKNLMTPVAEREECSTEANPDMLSISTSVLSGDGGCCNTTHLCHLLLVVDVQVHWHMLQTPPLLKLVQATSPGSVYTRSLFECHSPTLLVQTQAGKHLCRRCHHHHHHWRCKAHFKFLCNIRMYHT
jgi:hypothetical protein